MKPEQKNQINRLRKQNERLQQAQMALRVYLWDSKIAADVIQEIESQIIVNCEEIEHIEMGDAKNESTENEDMSADECLAWLLNDLL